MSAPKLAKECCYRSALVQDAAFCAECGRTILRCMAFSECAGLVAPDGQCSVCVAPGLSLDAGTISRAKLGGGLSLPLTLSNRSAVARPLFVCGVWVRVGEGEWRAQDLPWERIEAGASGNLAAQTGILEHAGVHRLEIALAVESRYRWRRETFAFVAGLEVTVEGDAVAEINQTITLSADTIEPGATVYAPMRLDRPDEADAGAVEAQPLPLRRAERLETAFGLRGDPGPVRVPRDVRFLWRGFGPSDAPQDGEIRTHDGLLALGRSRTKLAGGTGDIRMLASAQGGGIDETLSVAISRNHAGLYVENERLMLRAESDNGLLLDDEPLQRGAALALKDGSVVGCLPKHPDAAALRFSYEVHHGLVETVTVDRL